MPGTLHPSLMKAHLAVVAVPDILHHVDSAVCMRPNTIKADDIVLADAYVTL